MASIRGRLITILIISTGVVWLFATAWIFFSTRAEVERVLDARLMEAGRMVSSLITSREIESRRPMDLTAQLTARSRASYDRQLSCQIWSLNGDLVGLSESAPSERLTASDTGFSQTEINGETWRVYAVVNADVGVRVLVGDRLKVRNHLVNDVIRGLLLPMFLILPLLAGLIWLSVKRGLSPLNRIAHDLERRHAADLSPMPAVETAQEIAPVVQSLNGLFGRVAGLRDRERNFTAFAAHELRTPLAGLKTQAQVALASNDGAIRDQALRQIVVGVDRTGRLVRQLLDISSVEARERSDHHGVVEAGKVLRALAGELSDAARGVTVAVAPDLDDLQLAIEPELFTLAARNLIENAVNHSPPGGAVFCHAERSAGSDSIVIDDDGPGIPEEELPRVTERFFRGRNKAAVGSGLGLAIAELALGRSGWRLSLRNRPGGGLTAMIAAAPPSHG